MVRTSSMAKIPIEHNGLYPYLTHYLEWLKVKGFSPNTAHRRDSALRQFIQWCDERELNDPRSITKPILERYQRYLYYYRQASGQPLAFNTQNQRMTGVKVWFKWLTQENYIPSNPASEVMAIRITKTLPEKVLSIGEVHHILHSINANDNEGLRNRAMVEVLYSTGIRRTELTRLLIGDIDVHRCSVFVRQGKGGKDRCIPIGERALTWVQRYVEQARPNLVVDVMEQTLFLNHYGRPFTPSNLGHSMKRLLVAAGIDCKGGCHLFRHAMATHMLDNGAELRYIQQILGHSDINTTTVYTHLSIENLRRVYSATHPTATVSGHGEVN